MKISIITVAFNAERTIADTLRSVAEQTYSDIEYIVVDGASTDGSLKIIQQYAQCIAKFNSEPDRGIYDAMNKGLRLATGDIIGFLNADDVYADPWVIERVSAAMADGELDALFGDVEYFNPARSNQTLRRYRSARFRPERINWGWMPAHPTLFMRRHLYQHFGGFNVSYRIAGDFELVARMFHGGAVMYRYLPEVLVRMRIGGVSTEGWKNTFLLNREVLRACRENGIPTNAFKILSKYPLKLFELFYK